MRTALSCVSAWADAYVGYSLVLLGKFGRNTNLPTIVRLIERVREGTEVKKMRTRIRARRELQELERAIETAATPSMRDELLALASR